MSDNVLEPGFPGRVSYAHKTLHSQLILINLEGDSFLLQGRSHLSVWDGWVMVADGAVSESTRRLQSSFSKWS